MTPDAAVPSAIAQGIEAAQRHIPPAFPLAATVAVNPFLGQTDKPLAELAAHLARVGGVAVTMPRDWYLAKIEAGEIAEADLAAALAAAPAGAKPASVAALRAAAARARPAPQALPTVADLAASVSGLDWPALIADRIGVWAGAYFDQGQALWVAPKKRGAWWGWRTFATRDLTPEIMGLQGFAAFVGDAGEDPSEAITRAAGTLGLSDAAVETCFHQLLLSLGGWAQHARYLLWQAELAGTGDSTLRELLAIRLVWEEALYLQYADRVGADWSAVVAAHAAPVAASEDDRIDAILQEAAERAGQRQLAATLAAPAPRTNDDRPALQAAFCIDVRSEVFRRALESVDPGIRTLGFAGFFGVFAEHHGFASDVAERRLPVLLNPTVRSTAGKGPGAPDDAAARYAARAKRAWGRFKLAAVSSFAFVEAMGPVYVAKLLGDALGHHGHAHADEPAPRFDPALDPGTRLQAAETVLRAMSLTDGFARLVIVAGHGANVVNNPHASGLHCGACGGHSGEVNARLLAGLLNDVEVRAGLVDRGIEVPADTLFLAALHDTTTDRVTLYDGDVDASAHGDDLAQARRWLDDAGRLTRGERALRLPRAGSEGDIDLRSRDWSEVRPEWALAGCKAFIAAPRDRTAGRSLAGRAFLHDYDWRQDSGRGFPVLELILTAPVVVASWISLQYYGSTVAPQVFGGGNKLLHNVVGGIGVLEGNGGVMRAGLPWQSVHDGEGYGHEPLRLSVCVEAPREAITAILARHDGVRALFDNGWLHLFAMDEAGRLAWRYRPSMTWEAVAGAGGKPVLAAVA
ncbi:YbcC family protein [Palleronia sp. KMU-117]|uniref:YbcC family protein n=1 Tax=Palleronia sp. KMU-117 TaxID=3434108 RepID=UPI003D749E5C